MLETVDTVVQRTNLSAGWIRRLARRGDIPGAQKLGRDWVIPATWIPSPRPMGRPRRKQSQP